MPWSTTSDPENLPITRFLPGPRPRLIAHRGFALDGAENTVRAFRDALAAGATVLETDSRATADGTALAAHDVTLSRIAGDPRRVDALRDTDVPSVRVAGVEPLARLDEILDAFPDVPVNIDVKDAWAIIPVAEAIAATGSTGRVCITSFDDRIALRAAQAIADRTGRLPVRSPSRRRMAAVLAATLLELPASASARLLAPFGALQVPRSYRGIPVVTSRLLSRAHGAGCEVHVWTIDDPATMRDLLEQGVDGIITNRVDVLAELLDTTSPPRP